MKCCERMAFAFVLPRMKRRMEQMEAERAELTQELGREPTNEELFERLEVRRPGGG